MADTKVTALTEDSSPDGADLLYTVDDASGTPTSKKATISNVLAVNDSRTKTLTNTTIDADGTGNNLTNISASKIQGVSVDATELGSPSDGDILVYRSAGSDFVLEEKPAGGSNPAMADITDVTITSIASNEILKWNGSAFINQTLAEAGIQPVLSEGAFIDGDKTALDSALQDVADDTSPQLGGDLDVNGHSLVSVSNGDIQIIPDGTGEVVIGNGSNGNTRIDGDLEVTDTYGIRFEGATSGDAAVINTDDANFAGGELLFSAINTGSATDNVLNFAKGVKIYSNTELDGSGSTYRPFIDLKNSGGMDLAVDTDITAKIGDNAGSNKLAIQDSDNTEVFAVDSNGNLTLSGTVDGRDIQSDGATLDTALQPSDIASGTITALTGAFNLSGGSDGDVLTKQADGSIALETPAAGGGGKPYGATYSIGSGGDYATLNAYNADSPADGDILYIDGPHTLSAAVNISVRVHIYSSGAFDSLITLGGYNLTLSGENTVVDGVGFLGTGAGFLNVTGQDITVRNCFFSRTSTSQQYMLVTSANPLITKNRFETTASSLLCAIYSSANYVVIDGNYIECAGGSSGNGAIQIVGTFSKVSNNLIITTTATSGATGIEAQGGYSSVTSNTIIGFAIGIQTGARQTVSGNSIYNASTVGAYGIDVASIKSTISSNNIFLGGASGCYGIHVDQNNNTISSNTIESSGGTGTTGIYIKDGEDKNVIMGNMVQSVSVGIHIVGSSADRNTLIGNELSDATTPITDSGTNTFKATATDSDPLNQTAA